jgi:hypothetical protein
MSRYFSLQLLAVFCLVAVFRPGFSKLFDVDEPPTVPSLDVVDFVLFRFLFSCFILVPLLDICFRSSLKRKGTDFFFQYFFVSTSSLVAQSKYLGLWYQVYEDLFVELTTEFKVWLPFFFLKFISIFSSSFVYSSLFTFYLYSL